MELVKNLLVIYKVELQFQLTLGNSLAFKGGKARKNTATTSSEFAQMRYGATRSLN